MKKSIFLIAFLGVAMLLAFTSIDTNSSQEELTTPSESQTQSTMNSYVSIIEIPVTDFERAKKFYEAIMDLKIEAMAFDGMEMGLLPYENQMVVATLLKAEGSVPSKDGVAVYLNGGEDLQVVLDRIDKNGGKIIVPKTPHADGSGFFALFIDSEGNRLGLNSPK